MGIIAEQPPQRHTSDLHLPPPPSSLAPDPHLEIPLLGPHIVPHYHQPQPTSPIMYATMPHAYSPHVSSYHCGPQVPPLNLNLSQGIPPPPLSPSSSSSSSSPSHSHSHSSYSSPRMPHPHSPTFAQGMPPLSFSQGLLPPLSYSQDFPPPSLTINPPTTPTSSSHPLSSSFSSSSSSSSSLASSRGIALTLSLSDSQGIPPPSLSPTYAQGMHSPSFLHPNFSQPIAPFQTPPHSLNLMHSGMISDPFINSQPIPPAVLGNALLMNNISFARRYEIPVKWMRVLDITVHGARGITSKKKDGTNDAKCKITVETQNKITKVSKKAVDPSWEENFKFSLHETGSVAVTIYNHNLILADEEVCRGTITPSQFVEGSKVSNWFPLQPKGEINLSVGMSAPRPDSYRFVIHRNNYLSEWNYRIHDSNGSKVFQFKDEQKDMAYLRDMNNQELLHIKRTMFPWKNIDIYESNQNQPVANLASKVGLGLGIDFQLQILKNNSILQVKGDGMGSVKYMFLDHKNRNIAFIQAPTGASSAVVEIAADQDIPLFLICGAILAFSSS